MIRPRCQRRLLSRRLLCVNSSSRRASRSVSSAASRTVLSSVSSASANSRPGSCCRTSPVRRSLPSASVQRISSGRMRNCVRCSVFMRRRTEAVRSMRGSAAGVRGMAASHCSPRHSISASANRVVRTMRGMPLRSVTARASESVASDRSGVSSARVKCWMVAVMAIRF